MLRQKIFFLYFLQRNRRVDWRDGRQKKYLLCKATLFFNLFLLSSYQMRKRKGPYTQDTTEKRSKSSEALQSDAETESEIERDSSSSEDERSDTVKKQKHPRYEPTGYLQCDAWRAAALSEFSFFYELCPARNPRLAFKTNLGFILSKHLPKAQ